MKKIITNILALCISASLHAGERPNILLIVSEDNGQELSCYGDSNVKTPHLDSLAQNGMLFESGYVTQAVCSPSRGSIFTGLYPHQNGQIGLATHKYAMFKKWPTTYSKLQKAGYYTGMLGKTHINPKSIVEDYIDFRAIPQSNFAKKNLAAYAQKSAEFFKKAGDKPFFLTVNYPDAHHPLQNQVQGRPAKPLRPDEVGAIPYIGATNKRMHEIVTAYYNCMMRLDDCVGELLEALENSGKANNTVVIYIGDHGAQLPRGKIFATEAGMKVPYIIKWPGKIQAGVRSKKLVSTIDLMPTFCDLAKTERPDGLPGRSLVPLVTGQRQEWREYLAYERNSDAVNLYYPQRALRDGRYKLVWSPLAAQNIPDNGAVDYVTQKKWQKCSYSEEELKSLPARVQEVYHTWINPSEYQLYDLKNDEWEFENLAGNPEHEQIEKRLRKKLMEWMKETNDWASNPELLKKLTEENNAVKASGKGKYPKEGWQYLKYIHPDKVSQTK
ncbi:sulfatase [Verrucomicrobiaceae bacterium N1E253]|uniref:Sulfatase n=1 Tax=Oceaniferula marina TaxID=2748318 RepID=A0A851G959_9BACT|nr:sulfatase [Oceaniferula marina]NWK54143.1 sulfatase [Oceaniferula marina]